jgi:hypothetical protein
LETWELTVTELEFTIGDATSGRIVVHVTNTYTSDVTIKKIAVNGNNSVAWSSGTSNTIAPGCSESFTIKQDIEAETKYYIALFKIDGTLTGSCVIRT